MEYIRRQKDVIKAEPFRPELADGVARLCDSVTQCEHYDDGHCQSGPADCPDLKRIPYVKINMSCDIAYPGPDSYIQYLDGPFDLKKVWEKESFEALYEPAPVSETQHNTTAVDTVARKQRKNHQCYALGIELAGRRSLLDLKKVGEFVKDHDELQSYYSDDLDAMVAAMGHDEISLAEVIALSDPGEILDYVSIGCADKYLIYPRPFPNGERKEELLMKREQDVKEYIVSVLKRFLKDEVCSDNLVDQIRFLYDEEI